MKKIISISALLIISLITISCGHKKIKVLPATELGFCDFVLGGSLNECFEKANASQTYNWLSRRNDGLIDYASFVSVKIPKFSTPDSTISVLNGQIESFQDKIYSISYYTYWIDDITEMYQAKYGTVKPSEWDYERGDYHHYFHARTWTFENGIIRIVEQLREPLHYTAHRNHSITVFYFDNSIMMLAEAYKTKMEAQRDSLKRIEVERQRLEKEAKEQEDARIKREKQNTIIDSHRF